MSWRRAAPAAALDDRPPLRRQAAYLWLWSGQTVSLMGTQVTLLALPTLAIVSYGATGLEVGLLRAVQFVPFLVLGLPAGAWADRRRRRPLMVAANLGRMAALASVPVAFLAGRLDLVQLFAVTAVSGLCNVVFVVAYQSSLPDLVDRRDLVDANAGMQASSSAAAVLGPPLAGLLVQWIGAALAVAADAASFLLAALTVAAIRGPEPVRAGRPARRLGREIAEGLAAVLASPVLRRTLPMATLANLGAYLTFAVLLVLLYRDLRLTPGEVGLAYGLGGAGWLAGSLAVPALTRRLGLVGTMALSGLLLGAGLAAFALGRLGHPLAVAALAETAVCLAWPMLGVGESSVRQLLVPERLQGRTAGVARTLTLGLAPALGSSAGGVLVNVFGAAQAVVAGGVLAALAVALVVPWSGLDAHVRSVLAQESRS